MTTVPTSSPALPLVLPPPAQPQEQEQQPINRLSTTNGVPIPEAQTQTIQLSPEELEASQLISQLNQLSQETASLEAGIAEQANYVRQLC